MEYIRREIAAHPSEASRVFFADKGECAAARVNAWSASRIVVNHLRALVQLYRNPFVRPRGRVVFVVHGIHLRKFDFLPKTPANRLKRWMRLTLERYLYAKVNELVALTTTDEQDIHRLYGANLTVRVAPNTFTLAANETEPAAAPTHAFVCIARFDFAKGVDILLEAIALAQSALRRAGAHTLLIGGGAGLPDARRFAAAQGIADLVDFAGEIPNAGPLMARGRVLVAPSRWEGRPYLLLEAVARRRRIVASDCPGNRDVLSDYANAVLFPVCDARALAEILTREATA